MRGEGWSGDWSMVVVDSVPVVVTNGEGQRLRDNRNRGGLGGVSIN